MANISNRSSKQDQRVMHEYGKPHPDVSLFLHKRCAPPRASLSLKVFPAGNAGFPATCTPKCTGTGPRGRGATCQRHTRQRSTWQRLCATSQVLRRGSGNLPNLVFPRGPHKIDGQRFTWQRSTCPLSKILRCGTGNLAQDLRVVEILLLHLIKTTRPFVRLMRAGILW